LLHLIHPAIVHVTVAFLVAGGLSEAYGLLRRREGAERFGGLLVLWGTASLLVAVATGFLAENSLTLATGASREVDGHMRLGLIVLGTFLPLLVVKAWGRGRVPAAWRAWYAAGLLAGATLTAWTAFLGGKLVYELGVGVGVGR